MSKFVESHPMRSKQFNIVLLLFCVCINGVPPAAAGIFANVAPYDQRESTTGQVLELPLSVPDTGGSIDLHCYPAPAHSEDLLPRPAKPGLAQAIYMCGWGPIQPQTAMSFVVQVHARDGVTTGPVTVDDLKDHGPRYRLDCWSDLDGNRAFSPDECARVFPPEMTGRERERMRWQFDESTRETLMTATSTSFTLSPAAACGIKGARLQVWLTGLITDWTSGYMGDARELDPWQRCLYPTLILSLPSQAQLAGKTTQTLRLIFGVQSQRLALTGYQLEEGERAEREWMPYRSERDVKALNEAFEWNGEWWKIVTVDAGLTKVGLMRMDRSFTPPARGDVGGTMPDWTRLDLNTRQLMTRQDLEGHRVVLALVNANERAAYSGFRLMADRLKQAAKSGPPLEVLFVIDNFSADEYFQATAGQEQLPYRLLLSRDVMQSYESKELRELLNKSDGPLVIMTDEHGKVVLREDSEMYPLLPRLIKMLAP